jgi:hypothetical protein
MIGQARVHMAAGDLELRVTDVRGSDLHDTIRIELFDAQGNCDYRNREQVRRQITLTGIECGPLAFYRVAVTPTRYRTRQTFVAIKEGKTATVNLSFPVEPRKVKDIQARPFPDLAPSLQAVLEISDIPAYRDDKGNPLQGEQLYEALKPRDRACLLNLYAKASNTVLADGKSCFDHFGGLTLLHQDRFFARTHGALEEEAAVSPLFREESGALHEPPAGYTLGHSFKTRDEHGNLQLTFFRRGDTGDDYLVDVDIDEANGIEHVFEVVRNQVTGLTNPYDVREILIASQGLDPGYSFVFG